MPLLTMPQVSLAQLVDAARAGSHLVSFPTDTVPALAVRPDRASMIFEAKQRSKSKPLILMAGRPEDLWGYVGGSAAEREVWSAIAQQYWPGALTLVLPTVAQIPAGGFQSQTQNSQETTSSTAASSAEQWLQNLNPADPTTIGIRVPDSAIARHILLQTGPLATTSINRSGEPALTTIEEINAQFPQVLTLSLAELLELEVSLEGDRSTKTAASGISSTVAKWTGSGWEILRQGTIEL